MNSNLSIGAFSTTNVPRTEAPKADKENYDVLSGMSTITNTFELRKAQLSGEHVEISEEQLVKAIEKAIKKVEGRTTNLQFSIHEQTKRIAVKVLDRNTGEVIREIPPEKTLDFVAKLWEMAGILVDEKR